MFEYIKDRKKDQKEGGEIHKAEREIDVTTSTIVYKNIFFGLRYS
jgi:hypothetical protein